MISRVPIVGLLLLLAAPAQAADPAELLSPLNKGDELAEGWELAGLEPADDSIEVYLDPGGLSSVLKVRLTRRDEDSGAFCRTKSFNIVYLSPAGEGAQTPEDIHRAMDALCRRIKENDRGQIELDRFAGPSSASPSMVWRWPGWPGLLLFFGLSILFFAAFALKPARKALDLAGGQVERRGWLVLLILLIPAAFLRLACLDIPFEADYMTQRLFFGSLDIGDILAHRYEDQRHPQLFYLLLHFFLYFGHSEWIARLPAVLFSLGSAVALFALARPYLGAARSLVCVVLLLLSASYFEHSRDVGDISLFIMLSLIACHLFLRCLQEPTLRRLILLGLVETAMFYTYYMAVLVACAQLVVMLVHARSRRHLKLWAALGAAALLAVPAFIDFITLVVADMGTRQVARQFPGHMWGDTAAMQLLSQFAALLMPTTLFGVLTPILAIAGLLRWGRRSWKRPEFLLLAVLLVVSLIVIGLAVVLVRLRPYYLLFLLPAFLLFVVTGSLGLAGTGGRPGTLGRVVRALCWALLGLVVFAHANDLSRHAPHVMSSAGRDHFRRVGQVIQSAPGGAEADIVAADPDMLHTILVYYCFPEPLRMYRNCDRRDKPARCRLDTRLFVALTEMARMQAGWEQQAVERLQELSGRPFWFVYTDRFRNQPLLNHIRGRCRPYGEWPPLTLFHCPAEAPDG